MFPINCISLLELITDSLFHGSKIFLTNVCDRHIIIIYEDTGRICANWSGNWKLFISSVITKDKHVQKEKQLHSEYKTEFQQTIHHKIWFDIFRVPILYMHSVWAAALFNSTAVKLRSSAWDCTCRRSTHNTSRGKLQPSLF